MFSNDFLPSGDHIYPRFIFRLACSICIGIFLVVFGEENLSEMLVNFGFYLSSLGSIFIAIVVSEFIIICNHYCDRNFPWRKAIRKRAMLQGAVWFMSICLAVVLASVYFKLRNSSIHYAGYFKYDFTVVICLVVIVNAYYLILNLFYLKNSPLRRNYSNRHIIVSLLPEPETPAFIFSEGKGNLALQFNGERIQWTKTLKDTIEELDDNLYFLINRSEIIHRNTISGYTPFGTGLRLILKPAFSDLKLYVAQRRLTDFKKWFDGGA